MPPKKSASKPPSKTEHETQSEENRARAKREDDGDEGDDGKTREAGEDDLERTATGTKRKTRSGGGTNTSTEGDGPTPKKRRPGPESTPAPTVTVDPIKVISFLLSDESEVLCQSPEEKEALTNHPDLKNYRSEPGLLSPFEELVCALLLSKPINHRLGLRTIRTVLNEPYNFNTPGAIKKAGPEKRNEALWDAKTQHKDKTATQLGELAEVIIERFARDQEDSSLEKLREEAGHDPEKERELLTKSIKGIGETGEPAAFRGRLVRIFRLQTIKFNLFSPEPKIPMIMNARPQAVDILFRRLQGPWPELFPCVDGRTLSACEKFGLPHGSTEELIDLVERHGGHGGGDEVKKREVFVKVVDRIVGLDIENAVDQALTLIGQEEEEGEGGKQEA